MNIKSFEVDNSGRLVVNGNRIMWTTLSYVESLGDDHMTLQNKFEYLLDCKSKGIQPYINKNYNSNKGRKLSIEETLSSIHDYLDRKSEELYKKYKKYSCASKEDIYQELTLLAIELYRKFENTDHEIRKGYLWYLTQRISAYLTTGETYLLRGYMQSSFGGETTKKMIKLHKSGNVTFQTLKDEIGLYGSLAKYVYSNINFLCRFEDIDLFDIEDTNINIENAVITCIIYDNFMDDMVSILKEREINILIKRYGLSGDRELTLEELGKQLGVTRDRVRMIESKALRKLRWSPTMRKYEM